MRVAINGFGRIGRRFLRSAIREDDIEVVVINDLASPENLAYLFKYDSVYRTAPFDVELREDKLLIDQKEISMISEADPLLYPWKQFNIDCVVESSGRLTRSEKASLHIASGARRVIITAPSNSDIPTFVMAVNHTDYDPGKDKIISNASCTTYCLAILSKILDDNFGIEEGLMSTVHATTSSQSTVDTPTRKDWRIGRSSISNIIPASTGAAETLGRCLPKLAGKITGIAFRVPVPDGSVVDLNVRLKRDSSYREICSVMKEASQSHYKAVLGYSEDLIVSSDCIGSPLSCIFDGKAGVALNDRFFKLIAWYDNEESYAQRIVDLIKYMASKED